MTECEFCGQEEAYNFHHFIPRTLHSNKWFKKNYTREQMSAGMDVCKQCHKAIHRIIPDEKELGKEYNTREKLAAHPKLAGYLAWKRRRNA
jgi:2-oxo-4-hydroxy-4-carboxy--5-ureidoimidazoline (OHCU) decarboxylase